MSATRNKFSPEFRDRALRMVEEHRGDYPLEWAAMSSIAAKVGCTTETLRRWCREEASPKTILARETSGAGRQRPGSGQGAGARGEGTIMQPKRPSIGLHDPNETASGKPGTLHFAS
jgi:transposase-like protein